MELREREQQWGWCQPCQGSDAGRRAGIRCRVADIAVQTVSSARAIPDPHALFLLLNLAVAQVFCSDRADDIFWGMAHS